MSATDFRAFRPMSIGRFITTVALWSLSLTSMAAAPQPFLNAQQFNQPLVISTGCWPAAVAAADLNGDCEADLIYTDYWATVAASTTDFLLSKRYGGFPPGQTISPSVASVMA